MRLGLFFRDFRYAHVSHDHPRAGWTCVVISKGSKIDHYICPLCFPLFGKKSETHPWELCAPGDSERKGREQAPWAWTRAVGVTSVFGRLWHASTGWQSLKCMSHPLLCWSNNRRFLKERGARGWCDESNATTRIWSLMTHVGLWYNGGGVCARNLRFKSISFSNPRDYL